MAEVGVLNLTIKDNSQQAESGLKNLAAALEKVREAVKGISLGSFSNRLSKLAETINKEFNSSTIEKIHELGAELNKMSGAGNITIRIKNVGSITKASEAATKVNEATQGVQAGMAGTTKAMEGFSTAGRSIQQVTEDFEKMQNVMSDGAAKQIEQHISQFDMSKLNVKDFISDPITSLQERYKFMGDAAKDYKDNVDAVIPSLRNYRDTVMQLESKRDIAGFSKKTGEELIGGIKEANQEISSGVAETVQEAKAAVDSTPVYQSLEEAAQAMGISVEEAKRQCESALMSIRGGSGDTRVFKSIEEAAQAMGISVEEATQQCRDNLRMLYGEMNTASTESTAAEMQEFIPLDQFIEAYSHIDYLKAKLADLENAFDTGRKLGLLDKDDIDRSITKIIELRNEIKKLEEEQAKLGGSSGIGGIFSGLKESIKGLHMPFSGLLKQFTRLAKTRMLRATIRMISQGFSEGVGNVYKYSQAMGTSFSTAMDSAASSIAHVKNSVGAAIAPALQAVIPLFIQLAGVAIDALNAVNQLFALLGGQTSWTKALYPSAQAFNDMNKAAKGAGGSAKEMLADFDELNVIASQGGGGGAASDLATSFEDMFEQMFTFDQRIKDIIDFVKENMDAILTAAEAIGVAMLSWKLATAFMDTLPLLSKLFGGLSTAAVIAATLQLNWAFTNKFLETGEIGWLIADALTTAVGATAAWAIAKHFIGGNAGAYALAITLTLSAITGIVALFKNADVSALSKESLLVALENALKLGTAAGFLMRTTTLFGQTFSLGQSIAGGAATALITFGVVIGIKALIDKNIDTLSGDHIKAAVLSAVTVGGGLYVLGKSFFGDVIANTGALAAGAAFVTFGVVIGLKALIDPKVDGLSKEHIESAILSGLTIGAGMFILGKGVLANFVSSASALAAGAAFITIGAVVGIKAIPTYDKEGLSDNVIKQGLLGSLGIGLGSAFLASALGASLGAAAVIGLVAGGATLFTLGAIIGIKALFKVDNAKSTVTLTNEQVQEFVDKKLYEANLKVVLKNIKLLGDKKGSYTESIQNQVARLIPEIDSLTLGIDVEKSKANIASIINGDGGQDGLVKTIQELCNVQIEELKLSFSTIKAYGADGNEMTSEMLLAGVTGWSEVSAEAERLGKEITERLAAGAKESIDGEFDDYTKQLLKKLTDITSAITESQLIGEAYTDFEVELKDLSNKSTKDVIGAFDKMKKEIKDKYTSLRKETIKSYNNLAIYYEKMGNEDMAKQYRQYAQDLANNMESDIAKAVDEAMDYGRNYIVEQMSAKHGKVEKIDWFNWFDDVGFTAEDLKFGLRQALADLGYEPEEINMMEMIGISGWDLLSEEVQKGLIGYLKITPETYEILKEAFGITADDLIDITDWDTFAEIHKKELLDSLAEMENVLAEGGISSQYILDNWDLVAPIVEGKKTSDAIMAIENIITTGGKDSRYILENWNLIAPFVEEYGLEQSLGMIKQLATTTGTDVKTLISNWGLYAPIIDSYGLEAGLENIKTITKMTGENAKYILQNWNLIAPTVAQYGLTNSLAMIKNLAYYSGVDIKTIVSHWNLIAPLIDENNIDKSVDEIAKAIKDGGADWQSKLKNMKLEAGKVTMSSDFLSTATTELENGISYLQVIGKSKKIIIPVGVQSDGSSVSTAVHDTKEGGKYISLDTKPGYTFAEGGFPLKGSIFVANEAGPEMVGKIGSRSAVANTEQIVSGIAIGVSEANSEQNALLIEQNNLLRQILRKDNSVRIGASAALGRVAKQSIEMYGTVGG